LEGYSLWQMYVAGGFFMHLILGCLLIGLGLGVERFLTLKRATIDTRQFFERIRKVLSEAGYQAALELCKKTPGPVAAIFHAGLQRAPRGVEQVEKAIMNIAAVEMAALKKNMIWLTLLVTLAPLFGFIGAAQRLLMTFRAVEQTNTVSPALVAHGFVAALITILFGLIVALLVKTAHNFFTNHVEELVNDMEESSAELIDLLVEMEFQTKIPVNQIGQA